MTDKYDEMAGDLLPCACTLTQEITNGGHFMSCPFWFRTAIANALRAEAERITKRDAKLAESHECQVYREACYCKFHISDSIYAAQREDK
jgi:hypothetical protein